MNSIQPGKSFFFGTYPQGKHGERVPLEWQVLSASGDRLRLVTRHIIDCAPMTLTAGFFLPRKPVNWNGSYLRLWLNEDFLSAAFCREEQELLLKQELFCGQYGCRTRCYWDNRTEDRVALLRCEDVEYALSALHLTDCRPTPYAVSQGVSAENPVWWLREQGFPEYHTAAVYKSRVLQQGFDSRRSCGVRPSLLLRHQRSLP